MLLRVGPPRIMRNFQLKKAPKHFSCRGRIPKAVL